MEIYIFNSDAAVVLLCFMTLISVLAAVVNIASNASLTPVIELVSWAIAVMSGMCLVDSNAHGATMGLLLIVWFAIKAVYAVLRGQMRDGETWLGYKK